MAKGAVLALTGLAVRALEALGAVCLARTMINVLRVEWDTRGLVVSRRGLLDLPVRRRLWRPIRIAERATTTPTRWADAIRKRRVARGGAAHHVEITGDA